MRITIVSGFFLPVPPVSGGATEKSWHELARRFAAAGHEVTFISREWPGWSRRETLDGVRHVRLPGFNHCRRLWQNLLRDFWWSWRVFFALPDADVIVVHAVTLPLWLGRLKPRAGRVVLMAGRMPKGQYRRYRAIDRVLAPSSLVRDRVIAENPGLAPAVRVCGYPIAWSQLHDGGPSRDASVVTLGFIGRLHEEKGLRLLAGALELLARMPGLPAWRVLLCGPVDVARGGSGPGFQQEIAQRLAAALPDGAVTWVEPEFDPAVLAGRYRALDVFVYPSLAEAGETFGVAVAEAMAAGAVPVVSQLACFTDFVADGTNGIVFDHRADDAPRRLADALATLVRDPARRQQLATAASASVARYDFAAFAAGLLADFGQLTDAAIVPSSRP